MRSRREKAGAGLAAAFLFLGALIFMHGCSFPKIIVLHDPLSAEEHTRLGRIYESQGKEEQALAQYRAAFKRDPGKIQPHLLYGDLSYRLENYKEAERAYRKALKIEPGNGDILNNLCWTYIRQNKKLKKAEQLIAEAITLKPEHRPYYLDTRGVILLRRGRIQESIADLEEAVKTLPGDRPDLLAEAYGHLAEAYREAGDESSFRHARSESERFKKLR